MPHPVFDEILRARLPLRPDVFRRWQQTIRDEVLPALDAVDDEAADPPVLVAMAAARAATKERGR